MQLFFELIDSLLILTSGPAVCAGPFFPIEASAMPPDDAGRKNRKAGHSKLERVTDHVLTRFVTRLAIVAGLPLVVWGLDRFSDLRDEYGSMLTSLNLSQAASGAFGGERHGIKEAQVADDNLGNVARTTSPLRNQGFNVAAGLIQGDQNRALQAAQANQSAALQRASQQAQLEQEGNLYAADLAQQTALQQAQLNQQTASTNAGLTMQGRQADISSRYASDQQRLGAVNSMADATLQAQQLENQRILKNAALLNDIGNKQQQNTQADLDAPFRALEIRNSTLRGTQFRQTQVSTAWWSRKFSGRLGVAGTEVFAFIVQNRCRAADRYS